MTEPSTKIKTTATEIEFREKLFDGDFSKILNFDINCSACKVKLNWMIFSKKQIMIHPILEVLLCEGCLIGIDVKSWIGFCVWCGADRNNGVNLLNCAQCPFSFCEKCVSLNYGQSGYYLASLNHDWKCFICNPNKLWVLRAVCDAAKKFVNELTSLDRNGLNNEVGDCAICLDNFETIQILNCNHAFHRACLNNEIETNRSCPNCHSSYVATEQEL